MAIRHQKHSYQTDTAIRLHRAKPNDCQQLFEWRNDDWLISFSSSQRKIPWEEHITWFEAMLSSDANILLVIENDDIPVGSLRFDLLNTRLARVSIYIVKQHAYFGYGTKALVAGQNIAFETWPIKCLLAEVRSDNASSLSAFSKAGYRETLRADTLPDHIALVYQVSSQQ